MFTTSTLSVRVLDVERNPVEKATVRLLRKERGLGKAEEDEARLQWDERFGLFRAEIPGRGNYTLTVSARGFEQQSRSIDLPKPDTAVEFVLGRRGMPFYYRGEVKTPFEPRPELVALTWRAGAAGRGQGEGPDRLRELAKELGLTEVEVSDAIRGNSVLVFAFDPDTSGEQRAEVLERLLSYPAVGTAGPVVELFEERLVYLTNQLVVKFRSNVTEQQAREYARRNELRAVRQVRAAGNAYLFEGRQRADYSLLESAEALMALDDVVYAEPNAVHTSILYQVIPTDFLYPQQWHAPLINLPFGWETLRDMNAPGVAPGQPTDLTYGSEDITIVVYDTGIQSSTVGGVATPSHPEFQGTVTSGAQKVAALYDFINMVANNNALALGGHNHGMGCAGVATAPADNVATVPGETEGVAGAAGNCRVIGIVAPFGQPNLRWADSFVWMAGLDPGWVADGTTYPVGTVFPALISGADIHTNSTRIPDVGLMDDTLDFVAAFGRGGRGMVSFIAAGNTAANISHPSNNTIADHDKVLAIAASINTDVRSGYSCFDPAIDICAPSNGDFAQTAAGAPGKVTTDTVGGGNLAGQTGGPLSYRNDFGGTSSATPLAAGVGALMLSAAPELNWVQVRELLRNTAIKIDAANTDPVGQWTLDGMGDPVFSQWYGFGRVDAMGAVTGARDHDLASDVVVRDNLADDGSVPSGGWHANSPDIWVRRNDDPIPALAYGAAPPHQNPLRGQTNYLFLRVRNFGTAATNEVYLRASITHFPGFEFRYPEEWQPSVPPSNAPPSPLVPGTYLIGEVLIDDLAPGADTIVKFPWPQNLIPPADVLVAGMTVSWHPCILAEASPHDGPPPAGATFDVKRYNDLAHKNITIEEPSLMGSFSVAAVIAGTSDRRGVQALVLDRSGVVPAARIFVRSENRDLMAAWVTAVRSGRLRPAGRVPWREPRPEEPDRTVVGCRDDDSRCAVTLVDRTCFTVRCGNDAVLVVDAAAGSRVWLACDPGSVATPRVSVGKALGQEVIFFDGGGGQVLELPMVLAGSEFTPLAIGVDRAEAQFFGELRATQRRPDGELSPGYEIRG
jgi:hypothetical protein